MKRARKPDPSLAALAIYRRANREDSAARDALDMAEHKARKKGFNVVSPAMVVGMQTCISAEGVEPAALAVGFDKQRAAELVKVFEDKVAAYQQERIAAGLANWMPE
jgi:hypothetical protein